MLIEAIEMLAIYLLSRSIIFTLQSTCTRITAQMDTVFHETRAALEKNRI